MQFQSSPRGKKTRKFEVGGEAPLRARPPSSFSPNYSATTYNCLVDLS